MFGQQRTVGELDLGIRPARGPLEEGTHLHRLKQVFACGIDLAFVFDAVIGKVGETVVGLMLVIE